MKMNIHTVEEGGGVNFGQLEDTNLCMYNYRNDIYVRMADVYVVLYLIPQHICFYYRVWSDRSF